MRWIRWIGVLLVLAGVAGPALAQSEGHLREALEGSFVVVKMDLPATKEGVDLRIDKPPVVDFRDYRNRLRRYGTSLHEGQPAQITLIKVKGKHIEFHLSGGGFGTAGDPAPPRLYFKPTPKSQRELDIEAELALLPEKEKERLRRLLNEDLAELRAAREHADAQLRARARERLAIERARYRKMVLSSGSRFNVHFDRRIPKDALTPEGLRRYLAEYLEFSPDVVEEARQRQAEEEKAAQEAEEEENFEFPTPDLSPSDIHKGMSWEEIVQMLGRPISVEGGNEGNLAVVLATFQAGDLGYLEGFFVEEILVRYTISSR